MFGKNNLRHRNEKWHCMEVKIKSSGMLRHDDWWTATDVSKFHSVVIIGVKQPLLQSFRISVTMYTTDSARGLVPSPTPLWELQILKRKL
jgi:hypothetical protein